MRPLNVLVFWTFILFHSAQSYDWYKGEQRLSEFQTKYANSKADIFFLIDNSGSLWNRRTGRNGFYDEKAFVSSVLSKIRIAKLATRVAIIRFGDRASIDINYVTNLNGLNNKCEFTTAFSRIGYTGVMTNMKHGFQRVKEILFGSQSTNVRPWRDSGKPTNVNKVTFLLTDGRWNDGGNPQSEINFLKNEHVEIFTIGVTNVDKNFLLNAATSPDRYFYYNQFTDFAELATHIRGDPYQLDYDTEKVPKSKCTRTCDDRASCGCGLLSGKYVCICDVGHYGTGSVGDCTPCKPGTYKDNVRLATKSCTKCPDFSGHSKTGSSRISDCICDKGYEGDPASGQDCTIKVCLGLRVPANGYTNPSKCLRKYGSTCAFHCNPGFKLVGEKTLTCTVSSNNNGGAFWAPFAVVPECKRITCSSYRVSNAVTEGGNCTNNDLRVGTKCTYSCIRGYRLTGSSERTCLADETWSGTPTKCEVVTCPPLNSLTLAGINDKKCIEKPMRFDSICVFSCPNGYAFNVSKQQSNKRVCQDNGKWHGTYQVCKDIMAPSFTKCPKDKIFTYNTTFRLNTAKVSWALPTYEDNSQIHDVNHKVTLSEANHYESPHIFKIGSNKISYTVTDKEGLQGFCEFYISVEDHEPPYYTKCPPKIVKETSKKKERIVWEEPEFVDNSEKDPTITPSRINSDFFVVGQSQVFYTATDENGNRNTSCSFEVHVKALGCEKYKTPTNGALAWQVLAGSDMVTAYCKEGFDFGYKPAQLYYCSAGKWNTWPPGAFYKLPWPDCAPRTDPKSGALMMTANFYFPGDCNDKEVQANLKNRFVTSLKNPMAFPPTFCLVHTKCSVANVQIYCGATNAVRRRRRRGKQTEIYIVADYVVKPNSGSTQADFNTLKSKMNNGLLSDAQQRINGINWKNSMKLDEVKKPTVQSSEPYCIGKKGSVIGRCYSLQHNCNEENHAACLCNGESGTIQKCIECPVGKFYNSFTRKCEKCVDGTFQDVAGQFGCKKCLPGTSTLGDDAKNFTSCKEICKPGYFSAIGLAPCHACPHGQYSTDDWSKSCKTCPAGTVTVLPAATKIEDCGMKCARGTYSSNGVEPCKPCPKGFYQAKEGKLACLPCEGTKSTYGPGANSESVCIEINDCDSNPCNNGAVCKDLKDSYKCICKAGFTGRNCEKEVSECLSNPCYDNAVCVDKISGYECVCAKGFTGKNCDEPIPQCPGSACQNGAKCVEMAGTYSCECRDGFTGRFCEVNTDDCASKPCKNGGICRDGVDTFKCECRSGFVGDQCEINRVECASDPCQNGGACVDKVDGYICQCVIGFVGNNCEVNDNKCAPNPCKNRGKCVNKLGGFECTCAPSFSGKICETEQSSDFDLSFPTYEIRTFSKATLREDLRAFTLSFWMRTRDLENPGTPVSYSVKRGSYVEENGIVLKDYGNLAIQINNQTGYTSDPLNDGKWHHVAVTWSSSNGIWVYYRDGKEIKRASEPLAKGDYVRGGGELVLAQEQDWEAAESKFSYNPLEAFLGDMSQLNLWNKVLSGREIYNLAGSCNSAERDAIAVAWGDFASELQGSYKKTEKSHACDFSSSLRHFDAIYKAHLPSNDHKTLTSVSAEHCAKACEQETTFVCRSFDYNSAARKCFLSQAYRETVAIISSNNAVYDYYELSCLDIMGMESGVIHDSQLSASSAKNSLSGAKEARPNRRKLQNVDGMPNSEGGWIPSSFNQNQYLQIDLGKTMKVTGVETQGADGHSYWVQSYKLQHSVNGHSWITLPQTFSGNSDNKGRRKHQINLQARYVRLLPKTWSGGIGLRAELYGCSLDPEGVPTDLASIKASHSGSCSHNPCRNLGVCSSLPYGYACKCRIGYKGKTCETALSCDDPGTPVNGYKSSTNYNAGSTITFGCNNGYSFSGHTARKCVNGHWTGSDGKCENINECSSGLCNQHCTDFPGTYKCSCVSGYRLASNKRICEDINECQEKVCSHGCVNTKGSFRCTCPSGMKLDSSGTNCEDTNECLSSNGNCVHNCLNSFRSRVCHCKGGYTLHSDGRSCQEKRCSNPVTPANGKFVMIGDAVLGNSATYSCTDGFKLVGSDQRICQADGKWSGTQPSCQAVRCVDVGKVDHASRQGNGRGYNNRVVFTCQSTYRLLGTADRTCQKTGIWSNQQPLCVPNYCPALQAPAHGRINGFRTELGATVGVSCDTGYAVKGTSFRTCEASRKWSGSDPTCELVDCGYPGIPYNGYRHGNYYKYNSTISFSCKSRHHLEGAHEIKCLANGKWSAPLPECLARSCGNPGVPYNGFKHGTSHTYGSIVQYTCQKGYKLVGDRTRSCGESTAKWTGSLPSCQLMNCGAQAAPANGFRVGDKFTYNEILRFDCNPGYKLVGSNSRRCQANGVWSGVAPSCAQTSCGSFMHGPSGEIRSPNFPNNYDNNLYCTWQIDVPRGKKIKISFGEFKTESSKDFIHIFDSGKTDPIIEFSGVSYKPLPLTSSSNSIRIRFVSDGATSSNGFIIRYQQVDCGGMLETSTGVIQSPNYKGQYPSNAECSWLIHSPNKKIGLKFTDFNTQSSYDRIEIREGPYQDGTLPLINFSGTIALADPVVTTNYMYLRFITSPQNDKAYHGFRAQYEEYLYWNKK